jgi:transcriptional regulator with XRE-family HTH domain
MTTADLVKKYRADNGITNKQLAERMGISEATLANIIGSKPVGDDTLNKALAAIGLAELKVERDVFVDNLKSVLREVAGLASSGGRASEVLFQKIDKLKR